MRLKLLLISFLFFGLLSADFKIVGYYPNWGIYRNPAIWPGDIDGSLVTHVNYAFAKVDVAGNILLFDPWADTDYRTDWQSERPYWGNFKAFQDLKQRYPHLKTLISVGGWTLSDTFSELADNPAARRRFAESAVEFCQRYGFDGIDIDWEYPCYAEHSGRPQDKHNFTLLLAELRQAADRASPALLVTIASPAGPWHLSNMEIDQIHPYLDWFNVMTYDMAGSWDPVTGHQAALYPSDEGNPALCIASCLQYYVEQGVPPEKIVIGLPLYGRSFYGATGPFCSHTGAGGGTTWQEPGMRFFYDIVQNLLPTYHYFWDGEAEAAWLYSPHTQEFITFDDERALRSKCAFIRKMGLGGAMVWELGLDVRPAWTAMRAIADSLRAPPH